MESVIMGTMLLLISLMMVIGAILTSPKLERMGVRHAARYSFAAVCVLTAGLFLSVSTLFLRDVLGPENYSPILWGVRILLLGACAHYVWAIWHCDPAPISPDDD
jgi:drug/metabolite transporter (DMT)-like permease